MEQYNIFQAIFMSFYSRKLYRDVAQRWGAKAFLYLLLIVALSWVLFTIQFQIALNLIYKKNSDKIVEQVPVITIKDGKVSTPENRAYVILDPDTQERIAVIDTTGQTTTLEQAKASILITQNSFITQSKPGETKTNQIPANLNAVIDPKVVNTYVQRYLGFVWIMFFILFIIFAYIYRLVQALIYSLLGLIFNAISRVHLTYGQILQIALVAVTPAIILSVIFDFFMIEFHFQGLLYFALTMFYLWYGILANKQQTIP